jgi:thiol-disulfide isomerase/thioredoxin
MRPATVWPRRRGGAGSVSTAVLASPPVLALVLIALLALAACDARGSAAPAGPEQTTAVAPFRPCPASGPAPSTAAPGGKSVADLNLPCFVGGTSVALRGLGQPAVINLWASWCGPCRAELPEFQRLADRANGKVAVLGVVTADNRSAAASLAADLDITFPTLFDASSQLKHSVAPVLPVTLFVDANGVVRHMDLSGALALSTLEDLVHQHLGVVLS